MSDFHVSPGRFAAGATLSLYRDSDRGTVVATITLDNTGAGTFVGIPDGYLYIATDGTRESRIFIPEFEAGFPVADGVTDIGPLLQEHYDAGVTAQLPTGVNVWNTSVLDWRTDPSEGWIIEGTGVGSVLKLGTGLAAVSSFTSTATFNPGDVTTRWALIANTVLSAVKTSSTASAWAAATAYVQGNIVTDGSGHLFACTVAGTSGGSAPTWDTSSSGAATTDNTVTWKYMNAASAVDCGQGITQRNYARASGGGLVRFPRVTFRNLILDGNGLNAGWFFGNGAAVDFQNCQFINWKYGASWTGYTDSFGFRDIDATLAAAVGTEAYSWLLYGFTSGDDHSFDRIKCYTNAGCYKGFGTHGFVASNINGGAFHLRACDGVEIHGWHCEMNVPDGMPVPNLYLDCSSVAVRGGDVQPGNTGTNYWCQINDDSTTPQASTHLLMDSFGEQFRAITGQIDYARDAGVYITAANNGTTVEQRNPTHGVYNAPSNTRLFPDGPFWDSAVSAIQSALAHPSYAAALSAHPRLAGDCILRRRGGAWVLDALQSLPGITSIVAQSTPTNHAANNPSTGQGALTNGTTYRRAIATIDADGLVSQATGGVAVAASSTGLQQVTCDLTAGCTAVILFRSSGAAGTELSAPTHYVIIPVRGPKLALYDYGTHVNGHPWITTSVPVPNTTFAATTATAARLAIGGARVAAALDLLTQAAREPADMFVGAVTRDANSAPTSASVVWPDGATGTYTGTASTSFPDRVDSYTITHVLQGTTTTYTQSAVTRNSVGEITNRPAITVA